MGDKYDGRIESGPKTLAQKQKTASEMQKLLDKNDREMNATERQEIKQLKRELFGLKQEVAKITIANINKLKNLTPTQLITVLEANYKDETGNRVVEKGDGFDLAKQLALDMLGYYKGSIDSMWEGLSRDAERQYRIDNAQRIAAKGDNGKLMACFVEDLRAAVAGKKKDKQDTYPVRSAEPLPVAPTGVASVQTSAVEIGTSSLDAQDPRKVLDIGNVTLRKPLNLITSLTYDEVFNVDYAKKYRPYKAYIFEVARKLGVNANVFANMLIVENPKWSKGNTIRTTIGQVGRSEWKASVPVLRAAGMNVGSFTRDISTQENIYDQIKIACAYYSMKYPLCGNDPFVAAQLYHTGYIKNDARARYYAAFNPAILNAYNQYIAGPKVTANTIKASQYITGAKLFYAAQYEGTGNV